MHLFILLLLISFNSLAADWKELTIGNDYKVTQDFQLSQLERSRSKLDISRGDQVKLTYFFVLSEMGVLIYTFDLKSCPGPVMSSDLEMIPVQATSPMVEIGAQLAENCELNIYIETKDLMSKSIFE